MSAWVSVYTDGCTLLTDTPDGHPARCEHGATAINHPEPITPRPELGRGWNTEEDTP